MNKTNLILTALLALQLGFVALTFQSGSNTTPSMVSLFKDMAPEQISSLSISDDTGQRITLNKENNAWFLNDPQGFPADTEKAEAFVKKIMGLKSSQLVTRTTSSHNRLKVGDDSFIRKVDLAVANGERLTIYLGSSPNHKTMHARTAKTDAVFTVVLSSWEIAPDSQSWRRNEYIDIAAKDLREITLSNTNGKFVLAKNESETWTMTGQAEPLSKSAVKEFIDDVTHISLTAIGARDAAIDKPLATLGIKTREGGDIILTVGKKDGEKGVYPIKSSASPFSVFTAEYEVKSILDTKVGNFVTQKK